MNTSDPRDRVREILDFITEITLGNYTYTLPLRNHKDELEQIALSLNIMVEEIDTTVHQINHEKSKEVIENLIFNLDENFLITSFSNNIHEILKYSKDELINEPINKFISRNTALTDQLPDHIPKRSFPFQIEFNHHNGYQWSGYGYLYKMIFEDKTSYTLSAFKAIYHQKFTFKNEQRSTLNYPSEYRSLLLQDQRKVLQRLHKYIMERLDRKLQVLPFIAREVGGSVSKIKALFKQVYGDTIYNYHKRKRLEKAFLLLKETTIPINEIAEECGFKSFSHFSRSFKIQYGITPSQVRKS